MKAGDLVRVKDLLGYNAYMQNLAGHTGVVVDVIGHGRVALILLFEKFHKVHEDDLEVISESR